MSARGSLSPAPTGSYGSGPCDRIHDAVRNDTWRDEFAKTRLNRLYGQAMRAWQKGNRQDFDRLRPLIEDLKARTQELTEAEDVALRLQYRLSAAVAI